MSYFCARSLFDKPQMERHHLHLQLYIGHIANATLFVFILKFIFSAHIHSWHFKGSQSAVAAGEFRFNELEIAVQAAGETITNSHRNCVFIIIFVFFSVVFCSTLAMRH